MLTLKFWAHVLQTHQLSIFYIPYFDIQVLGMHLAGLSTQHLILNACSAEASGAKS